jgi:hypothetical protein
MLAPPEEGEQHGQEHQADEEISAREEEQVGDSQVKEFG